MPTTGLTPIEAAKWRRHTSILLFLVVILTTAMLAVALFGIYTKVANTQDQINDAIRSGPEGTQRALCAIFETFDRLSEYHHFPPATDKRTRDACAGLAP